jgi:hypothetical protein
MTPPHPSTGSDDEDDDTKSSCIPSSVPTVVLLGFLMVLEATATAEWAMMDLVIDTQTLMRLSVSCRIETALDVAHLHQDSSNKATPSVEKS